MSIEEVLRNEARQMWEACYHHPFVQEIGRGSLNKNIFKFYLQQDYKFLLEFSKIYALAAAKANSEEFVKKFTGIQIRILDELELHRQYFMELGMELSEINSIKPTFINSAYTSSIMAVGYSQGLIELVVALLPCPWTYFDFACRLKEEYAQNYENNFYKKWIDAHTGGETCKCLLRVLKNMYVDKKKVENLVDIFMVSVQFEYLFWNMAYNQSYDITV